MATIKRIYCRTYRDTGQKTIYVEWSDVSRTECDAERACSNRHMRALIQAAHHHGLKLTHETW